MKRTLFFLALPGLCLGGVWWKAQASNANWQRSRLEAPFVAYAQAHKNRLKYGQVAPDFALKDARGHLFRLSEVCARSRLTLVVGVAPDDDPSTRQLFDLREADHNLGAQGLSVLALSDTDSATAQTMSRRLAFSFPLLLDPDRAVQKRWGETEPPYALLLTPERRVLFTSAGYEDLLGVNRIVNKATLELTGKPMEGLREFGKPVLPPITREQPLVLNGLNGEPVTLPLPHPAVYAVFSSGCASCPQSFDALAKAWKVASRPRLVVVMTDSIFEAGVWLKERQKELSGAVLVADPSGLFRKKTGLVTFGGSVLLDETGAILERVNAGREDQLKQLLVQMSHQGKGGEAVSASLSTDQL
jgi:peroxiredoxin